jgi:hypothetical protein
MRVDSSPLDTEVELIRENKEGATLAVSVPEPVPAPVGIC